MRAFIKHSALVKIKKSSLFIFFRRNFLKFLLNDELPFARGANGRAREIKLITFSRLRIKAFVL